MMNDIIFFVIEDLKSREKAKPQMSRLLPRPSPKKNKALKMTKNF